MNPMPVATPEPAALRIGLVAGGRAPADAQARWELGIIYDPDFDHLGGQYPECPIPPDALDPGDLEKDIPDGQENNEWWPYSLWLGEKCSALGGIDDALMRRKVTRQMVAQTSHLLEETFSTGFITLGEDETYSFTELGMPNRALESSEATFEASMVPYGIVEGISVLVGMMADSLGGARGMVHVPAILLPFLDFYGQIVRNPADGRFIALRSHDHVVIAGSGYDGNAPDGSSTPGVLWIYGTSPVEVRLAAESTIPDTVTEAVDRRSNDVEFRAERLALASWDLSTHVAVPISVIDPGPETSS